MATLSNVRNDYASDKPEARLAGPCIVSKVYENALGRLPIDMDQTALGNLIGEFVKNGNKMD